jgi:hypothetical protein
MLIITLAGTHTMLPEDITQAVLTSTTFLTVWGVQTPMLVILPTDFKGGMAMMVMATEQHADFKDVEIWM